MSDRDEFEQMYSTLQLGETLVENNGITLVPSVTRQPSPTPHDSLPHIRIGESTDLGVNLRLHDTLGQGGMGLVRAAEQIPIGRNVAVKTLLPEHATTDEAAALLVREAIITGRLEHPNVVPIYSVGRDDEGLPVIVMKRVEGSSWRERLDDPGHSTDDALDWHLDVFKSVCTATHFAHTRGVIHRDIKPDNVMLGDLGEVYLVDWGLALRLDTDPTGALPSVHEVSQVAGTPAYMAPEMASGDFAGLGIHTDVYLLGALLHELVTGTTRHQGTGVFQLMFAAHKSEPVDYPDDVPPELGEICNRATAQAPDERYPSALALRDAIDEFLAHRDSRQLADEAHEELDALRELVTADAAPPDAEAQRIAVYRRFGAARFGFENALSSWPGNMTAVNGLEETYRLMVEWELAHDSPHAARAMLAELNSVDEALMARVEEVEARQGREREQLAELRTLQRDLDTSLGQQSRGLMLALLLLFGIAIPAFAFYQGWLSIADPFTFWLIAPVTSTMTCAGMWAAWKGIGPVSITHTETNRKMLVSVFIACGFLIVFRGAALLGGATTATTLGLELIGFSGLVASIALAYDKRLVAMTPYYAIGGFGPLAFPEWGLPLYGLTHGLALAHMSVRWSRKPDEEAES